MKRLQIALICALVFLSSSAVLAAEAEPVNPPGWVGGLFAALAIILPLTVGLWLRNRGAVARGRH